MQGGEDMCYYGDGHVTGDNHFILDVPHLLHGVVIFSSKFKLEVQV